MLKRRTRFSVAARLAASLFVTLSLNEVAPGQDGTAAQLPPGNWAVRCSAFRAAGYEALPVLVTGVTSDVDRGIEVTGVNVTNRSNQRLTAVRLSWYLSTQDEPASVLRQGRTKVLNLKRAGGIDPGETREITFPVVSFAAIHKPLLRGGELNGKYIIQVAASEVRFDDGSSQTLLTSNGRRARAAAFVQATFAKTASRATPAAQTFCPNQTCEVVRDSSNVVLGYRCISSVGETCSNSSTGKSCNSSLCETGGGGRPPILP
jgi:hypothetical protein